MNKMKKQEVKSRFKMLQYYDLASMIWEVLVKTCSQGHNLLFSDDTTSIFEKVIVENCE